MKKSFIMKASLCVSHTGKLVSLNICKGFQLSFENDTIWLSEFDTFEITYNSLSSKGNSVYFSFNSKFIDEERGW
jgi:hypothetical protein